MSSSKVRTTSFMRGSYSFRPLRLNGVPCWTAHRKGAGKWDDGVARLSPATDGACWIVSVNNSMIDARPSFREACDLVMARLPIGEAR